MSSTPSWTTAILLASRAIDREADGRAVVDALTRASVGDIPALSDLMETGGRDLALALAVGRALPTQHATWPLDVLAAARTLVRDLPWIARSIYYAGKGDPFDPARLRAGLERLGADATTLEPVALVDGCKRCGSRRRDTLRDSSSERYRYEHHCLACGYMETEIGDVTLSTAMSEGQKRLK